MPSSLLSFFSIRFAQEAQVMPLICNSIPARFTPEPVVWVLVSSVVMVLAFLVLAGSVSGAWLALTATGGIDHQRRGMHLPIDLEV